MGRRFASRSTLGELLKLATTPCNGGSWSAPSSLAGARPELQVRAVEGVLWGRASALRPAVGALGTAHVAVATFCWVGVSVGRCHALLASFLDD